MSPNTYCHVYTTDGPNKEAALAVAIAGYVARWGIKPANVFVHPDMLPIIAGGVVILADKRLPAGQFWLEVPAALALGGNGR
jgi:hypothetical protein